jgi:hypothetical protein
VTDGSGLDFLQKYQEEAQSKALDMLPDDLQFKV